MATLEDEVGNRRNPFKIDQRSHLSTFCGRLSVLDFFGKEITGYLVTISVAKKKFPVDGKTAVFAISVCALNGPVLSS